ncbi:pathogenicity island 2 effector protein SseG [Salmonella enterica subsp. enterica]|nr:pathogenicity island 2 effector protein SseG [Salmonella enterica]EBR9915526.1 pathogenicity island 2 effector protein SseG [Salmonella enterica subsp. enterica serovar Richmond]EEA9088609.1 pathogenicity island 2 effector protein SseG [Salmonella enterica subsp. enterica]ECD2346631.1 pathogenicity island 2 effector protein SseG [Salmonella enterica subsp. enterica serovar Richmond]ECE7675028.1 pathogenicity island 2 effector protein SseG [Salmonella enterica subsp. enterica serovar Richmond
MKPVSPNAQVAGQRPVNAPEESPPCPSLPHPETNMESGRIGPQQGKERVLAGLAKRVIECFPKEIFSWQTVILGGQILCCSAGIALTVLSGGGAPLVALAGIGLAIAIADVACLIYHHKHHLPMAHGGRLALTATVMTHSYWSGSLGLQPHLLERLNDITYGLMSFTRFGMDGMAMTGMQVSSPLYRLLAQVTPEQRAPE